MENSKSNVPGRMQAAEELDLKSWFSRLLRLWPWFLAFQVVSLTVAWLYLKNTERVYQSDASLMIRDEKRSGSGSPDNSILRVLNVSGSGKVLENEIEVLKSVDLLRDVVLREKLYILVRRDRRFADLVVHADEVPFGLEIESPEKIRAPVQLSLNTAQRPWTLQSQKGGEQRQVRLGDWYDMSGIRFRLLPRPSTSSADTGLAMEGGRFKIDIQNPTSSANSYKGRLLVKQVGKQSTVIALSVKDLHYERGNAFLRSLIRLYNEQVLNDKNLTTSNTIQFLDDRLLVVEKGLRDVESDVERYKRQNKVTDLSDQSKTLMVMVQDVDRQKALQQTQVNVVEALERELSQNSENPRMVPSTLGVTDVSAASLIEKHNQLLLQRERMAGLSGSKNPAFIDLDNQVREVRQTLLENVRNLKKAYSIELGDVLAKDRRISRQLDNVPVVEKQLVEISRDRNVKQQIYLFLLQKREESAIALASSVTDGRTVESPHATRMVHPDSTKTYVIAFALGLLLAMIPMALIDFFHDKVGSAHEVANRCRAPLIGQMKHVRNLQHPIQIGSHTRNAISEQIRSIRTNLSFTGNGSAVKRILVTSHIPGEGKGFTCLNIAASYAILEKKVLVMEFDLRKPRLIRNLGMSATKGISNFLSGQDDLDGLILPVDGYGERLFVMPSGHIPPNPSELILGSRMEELMRLLSERFDYIVIDSPPFSMVTDAILLKRHADVTLVVLRQGYSFREAYREINEKILGADGKGVYLILNGVNKGLRYSYYSSRYGDTYAYGYSEGEGKGYFDKA